jgi:hypothetical protein
MSVRPTEPGDRRATESEAMFLANAGWIQREDGWVYPDLDLGDSIPVDEALRIERDWQAHDAEASSR